MKIIVEKETGLFIRLDENYDEDTENGLEVEVVEGFYIPKWNGESWEEGATQEHIDSLKAQPTEPTETERLEALEMLMVDILGGGF